MTYLLFDVVFLVVPAVSLLASARDRLREPRAWWALVGMMVLAVAYTGPWDSHLVRTGVWDYGADRVQWTIAAVPVEEYAFMLLQVLLTGSFLLRIERRLPGSAVAPTWRTRAAGAAVWIAAGLLGAALLPGEATRSLGLILVWASPVLAGQWALGGGQFWSSRGLVSWSVTVPTLYLWVADWIALRLGIWEISPFYSTGIGVLGLPVEEMAFFALTNLLVVQGMLLVLRGPGSVSADSPVSSVSRSARDSLDGPGIRDGLIIPLAGGRQRDD
jgi:lycopene cyclase domain-containing protein